LKVYDEIVAYIQQQIEAQDKREAAAGVPLPSSPNTQINNNLITPPPKKESKKHVTREEEEVVDSDDEEEEQKIIRHLMAVSQAAEEQIAESDEDANDEEIDDGKDPEYVAGKKKEPKKQPKKRPAKAAKTAKNPTISKATTSSAPAYVSVEDTPAPPSLQEHIESMFSNKIQSLHMIWILQANKRGIITDIDADRLQFLPYNNQSPFFIVTLFLVLYEALKVSNVEQARRKWQEDGLTLFSEILDMIERRK
jgi:hypothetical protein